MRNPPNHEYNEMPPTRSTSSTFGLNPIISVLLIAWVARYLFVALMPPDVRSADSASWEYVARAMEDGHNPYKETRSLNWPPVWMQLVYLMDKISVALNVPFVHVLQFLLTAVESLVILALFSVLRQIAPQARAFGLILAGIALNPITIFLTCQHGNFDVIVGLWVLLFVGQLAQFHRSQEERDWLAACLFLGLGILTKTVPLVLCPLLAGGLRRVAWRTKWLGLALTLGPVLLGMSVIYVLAPEDVAAKVLAYRSASGWFGISGLLHLAGADALIHWSNGLFYLLLIISGALVAYTYWQRERVEAREIVLCATMFLLAIPGIGPGYSPQYLYWSLPLLIVGYTLYDAFWRRVVLIFGIVAVVTCLVEYAIVPSHGMYLFFILKQAGVTELPPTLVHAINWFAMPLGEVVTRLPMFVAFLALLVAGVRRLIRNPNNSVASKPAPKGKAAK